MTASLGGSEATGPHLPSTLNPQPSLLLTQTSLCLPGCRHLYLVEWGLEGTQCGHVSSGPLSLGSGTPAVVLSFHTPCSLPSPGPGYLSHTVPGTADPGGRPPLWTQEFHKNVTGCAALAGPRPVSSRWSHGAASRARVSLSRPGLCFSSRHSSLS